jgi:hypothetical protein
MCHERDIRTGTSRISAIWLLLILFSAFWPFVAFAETGNSQRPRRNLFLLPLEDVMKIDVRGSYGIRVQSRRVALGLIGSQRLATETELGNSKSISRSTWARHLRRRHLSHVDLFPRTGNRPEGVGRRTSGRNAFAGLLLIDDWEMGPTTARDLRAYLRHLKPQLQRLELYTGESAYWLSDGRSSLVVNVITSSRAEDTLARGSFTQEGGR